MSRSTRNGLSLVEVLVILAIVVMLAGLFLPAVRRVREASDRMKCSNNLKQVVLSFQNYAAYMGRPAESASPGLSDASAEQLLPPGCVGPGATPEERLSWMVALLPYVEQESLYRSLDLGRGYAGNLPAVRTRIPIYLCPESEKVATGDGVTNYVAMAGIGRDAPVRPAGAAGNGFMGYDRLTSMGMITDGTSNTVALMETRANLGPWARGGASTLRGFDPANVPVQGDRRPFGGHEEGMNVAMADGSVRFLDFSIDPAKLADAITIAGGEPFGLE